MSDDTITIPRDAVKVLGAQALISRTEMAHVDAADIIRCAKSSMLEQLAAELMEHTAFEARETDIGTRFRVKIRLIRDAD